MFETFNKVSKADWLAKVEKDLKGKEMHKLQKTLSNGDVISPFYHSDDVPDLPNLPITKSDIKFGQFIQVNNEVNDNELILEHLSGGVNIVFLTFDHSRSYDFPILFKDILFDLITTYIVVDDATALKSYFQQREDFESIKQNVFFNNSDIQGFELGRNDVTYETQEFLKWASSYLEKDINSAPIWQQKFTNDYINNIVQIRTIKLLWFNLCEALQKTSKFDELRIVGIVDQEVLEENANQNMISLSHITTSMMSSGIDIISCPSSQLDPSKDNEFYRRISRNLFHLLTLEGHLDKVVDPAAGSYCFESLSIERAQEAWKLFIQ